MNDLFNSYMNCLSKYAFRFKIMHKRKQWHITIRLIFYTVIKLKLWIMGAGQNNSYIGNLKPQTILENYVGYEE